MSGENRDAQFAAVDPALLRLTYLIYALHLFSAIVGVLTSAMVVTAFLMGWPSIIAVILNYAKRGAVAGSYLDSHFAWQIRTFWLALLWLLLAWVLILSVIALPLGFIVIVAAGIWVLYRMIRGLLRLNEGAPMPQ